MGRRIRAQLRPQLPSEPVTIFGDSFEISEWNGKWGEDSQNYWFRSTQRATQGARSAEVDGNANNATLTLSTPIDLTGYSNPELTFDWLIENGFDSGEYLSIDVSSDGGATWQSDVRRLSGNVDADNSWHSETVNLAAFMSANTLIRFRSKVSSYSEDASIDNVKIVGRISSSSALMTLPDTFEPQSRTLPELQNSSTTARISEAVVPSFIAIKPILSPHAMLTAIVSQPSRGSATDVVLVDSDFINEFETLSLTGFKNDLNHLTHECVFASTRFGEPGSL
ncbi:MAG: hypothetical protein KDB23_25095 [Planctomycetales bacterium]|nr:hypothetical protein [Planctomycetales bacterium]